MSDYTLTAAEAEAIDRDLNMTAADLEAVSSSLKDSIARLVLYGHPAGSETEFLGGLRQVADGACLLEMEAERLRAMATTPEVSA